MHSMKNPAVLTNVIILKQRTASDKLATIKHEQHAQTQDKTTRNDMEQNAMVRTNHLHQKPRLY